MLGACQQVAEHLPLLLNIATATRLPIWQITARWCVKDMKSRSRGMWVNSTADCTWGRHAIRTFFFPCDDPKYYRSINERLNSTRRPYKFVISHPILHPMTQKTYIPCLVLMPSFQPNCLCIHDCHKLISLFVLWLQIHSNSFGCFTTYRQQLTPACKEWDSQLVQI
jgi:hypothetical protein